MTYRVSIASDSLASRLNAATFSLRSTRLLSSAPRRRSIVRS